MERRLTPSRPARGDTLRRLWLRLHRWLGLAAGVFFTIASLTGAVLVYEQELDVWINGGVYRTTAGDVGAAAILARAQRDAAGQLTVLRWPQPRDPVYIVEARTEAGDTRVLRYDPGTGEPAEQVRRSIPLIRLIRGMHTSLLAGRPGHYLVLVASALALVSFVTGLILWWPGIRRIARGFGVRTHRGLYPFTFDAHQVVGAVVLPLLFMITLTGILIPYQSVTEKALGRLLGGNDVRPAASRTGTAVPLERRLPATHYIRAAVAAVPDGAPVLLRLPIRADGIVRVELLRGRPGRAGGVVAVTLDPGDASVLVLRDPRDMSMARRIAGPLNFNLHVGAVGGWWVRPLYVLVCLVGAALAVTGFMIWWLKRTRIAAAVQRRTRRTLLRAGA
jgi:uncharacterized iron-regulated membrane protein